MVGAEKPDEAIAAGEIEGQRTAREFLKRTDKVPRCRRGGERGNGRIKEQGGSAGRIHFRDTSICDAQGKPRPE